MKGYIGSVRFFKNLILLAVIIFIAVPTGFSVHYRRTASGLQEELTVANDRLSAMEQVATPLAVGPLAESQPEEVPEPGFTAEVPSYQELYPDFYAPQELTADQAVEGTIYLTFDDGPSARTPEVLEILREEGVKATFFVVGKDDEQSKQWMRDIVAEGHTLAMHSYSHEYRAIYASVEDYLADMYQVFSLIKEATGETPTAFRFPGGSISGHNYSISQDLISEMLRRGFVPYDWNLSSGDAADGGVSADAIVANVLNDANVTRGIVLMHDSAAKHTTVEGLRPMIQGLREKGYTFDRITPDTKPVLYAYRY